MANSDCVSWLTSGIKYKFNPITELNSFISDKRFFKGGTPGSVATTYDNGGGTISIAWIGLRKSFFQQSKWERVNTILHELRHAMHLGFLAHPDSFKSKAAWDDFVINQGGTTETQRQFNLGVEKNCLGPLKRSLRNR